jgi:NACHT domain
MASLPTQLSTDHDERKLQRLRSITNEVAEFHPLLQRLLPKLPGVTSVEYTHGTLEHGADFVVSKTDLMVELPSYSGVIAKCGNLNKGEIHRVIEQARECGGERFFLSGKQKIMLSEILVVTTGTVAPHAKQLVYDEFAATKVHFIDRDHLVKLINKYFNSFWTDVDVHVGDYLSVQAEQVLTEDRELSLLPQMDEWFYIDQEIVRLRARDPLAAKRRRIPKIESVSLVDEIKAHRFILIEGDAGVGKSKCAREIARLCCDAKNYNDTHLLPIRIACAELFNKHDGNLTQALAVKLVGYEQVRAQPQTEFLFIIDGLDELKQSAEDAGKQITRIAEQTTPESGLRAILFSRSFLSEFGESLTIAGAVRLELLPLSLAKTILFLKRLCSDLSPSTRLFEDLKKSAIFNQLPKSPIAAILLARILREKQTDLPSTLPELYNKYFELALGRWDVDRGLQSEKEYEALSAVLMEIADFFMQNELESISHSEATQYFERYLEKRNLGLTAAQLVETAVKRCPILRINQQKDQFSFKHRTFVEFLFAKKALDQRSAQFPATKITHKAFSPYWFNSLYFYVGLRRDCEDLLAEVIDLEPQGETESWIKAFSLSDVMLAAYTTPYNVIIKGIVQAALGVAKIHGDVLAGKSAWGLDALPHIHILGLMQYLFKQRYAYEFLQKAMPDAVQEIMLSTEGKDTKAYAVFFISMAYKKLGGKDNFDFLLTDDLKPLPMPLQIYLTAAAHEMQGKSKALRKHEKRMLDSIRSDPKLRLYATGLFEKPASALRDPQPTKRLQDKKQSGKRK